MGLETFGTGQGYLKAGFLGFAKSGKTYTAALLAIEVRRRFDLKTPIALFDTETGGEYITPLIREATGLAPIGRKSRSRAELLVCGRECEAGAAGILIADSVTHVWREACAAYLKQLNEARDRQGRAGRQRLEFQDWSAIKDRWNLWTDFYLNSRLHIIICGRAGFEWDFEQIEDSQGQTHRELVKKGVKMKVESEFGFEPSLLVEMERVQVPALDCADRFRFVHRARVLGDRFDKMDGAVCDNPTGAFFAPHLDMLTAGAENVVDTTPKTDMGVDESGEARIEAERRERGKLLEEIEGELVVAWPGQTAAEKRFKVEALDYSFGTKSWATVKAKSFTDLRRGLELIRMFILEKGKRALPEEKANAD